MKNKLLNKRIPTLLGLGLVVVSIGVLTFLVQTRVINISNASPDETPTDVRITNIADTAFTVTYKTPAQVIGSVTYGTTTNPTQIALDDRDQSSGTVTTHMLHSITIKTLTPSTRYYFSIKSGNTIFLNNNQLFQITTGPTISTSLSSQKPLTGKVVLPNGQAPTEAILYIQSANGQTLSTLTKTDGLYVIPLNTMRDNSLATYTSFADTPVIQILAQSPDFTTTATFTTGGENSVPIISLSNNYDFTTSENPIASTSAIPVSFPVLTASASAAPQITTPTQNAQLSDVQPTFKGIAQPGETVQITIHSTQAIQASVKADSKGNWTYRPSTALTPGVHTITIISKDAQGVLHTIAQSFTVYAQGSTVNQSATPSATLTPTKKPTPTNTPTPTVPNTPTPTQVITTIASPTTTPSLTPSTTPSTTPQLTSTITPTQSIAPTGSNSVVFFGTAGIVTTIVGILLFLATRGSSLL